MQPNDWTSLYGVPLSKDGLHHSATCPVQNFNAADLAHTPMDCRAVIQTDSRGVHLESGNKGQHKKPEKEKDYGRRHSYRLLSCATSCEQLHSNLTAIDSNAQILQLFHCHGTQSVNEVNTDYGPVPFGCAVSYQHGQDKSATSDIVMFHDAPPFPNFPMPEQPNLFSYVLSSQVAGYFDGLRIDIKTALALLEETRLQSDSKAWHSLQADHITSSIFKQAFSRATDFDSLADMFQNRKNIQTKAMK